MSDYGDNWPVENPELHKVVEQVLRTHSLNDSEKIALRLLDRVKWLRHYWAKEDY